MATFRIYTQKAAIVMNENQKQVSPRALKGKVRTTVHGKVFTLVIDDSRRRRHANEVLIQLFLISVSTWKKNHCFLHTDHVHHDNTRE